VLERSTARGSSRDGSSTHSSRSRPKVSKREKVSERFTARGTSRDGSLTHSSRAKRPQSTESSHSSKRHKGDLHLEKHTSSRAADVPSSRSLRDSPPHSSDRSRPPVSDRRLASPSSESTEVKDGASKSSKGSDGRVTSRVPSQPSKLEDSRGKDTPVRPRDGYHRRESDGRKDSKKP